MQAMNVECIVCGTHMGHYQHDAMNMSCRCLTRVCHACVQNGNLRQCPTCRKRKARPTMDRQWAKALKQAYGHKRLACLGCHRDQPLESLRLHEEHCAANRNRIQELMATEITTFRERLHQTETARDDMQYQIEAQEDTLDELEEQCSQLEGIMATHEMERQLYDYESGKLAQALLRAVRPLEQMSHRLSTVASRLRDLRGLVVTSRRIHRDMHRRRLRNELPTHVEDLLQELVPAPRHAPVAASGTAEH